MAKDIQDTDGTSTKASKASERARSVTIVILERQGQTVLVEFDLGAGPRRVFVPAKKLKGNDIGEDVLAAGIPYGENWRTWVDDEHGEAFAAQLYATKIFTKQDFLARSGEVRAALQRCYVNEKLNAMLQKAAGG